MLAPFSTPLKLFKVPALVPKFIVMNI